MRWSALAASFLLLLPPMTFAQAEVTNVGIDASLGFVLEGGYVAIRSSEARSGMTDLNGDGDTDDFVLHLYDTATGQLTNTGLEASSTPLSSGSVVVWSVFESRQGMTDLNGDGDASDFVVHVADAATGTVTNLGIASTTYATSDSTVAVMVLENGQGMTDLNGDGDANDGVLHVFDVSSGTLTNVAVDTSGGFVVDGVRVVFGARETSQGMADLNGDGDATDTVLHLREGSTTTNLGRASMFQGFKLGGDLLAFMVVESADGGVDRNGDGDTSDGVMHVLDLSTSSTVNLGLAVTGGVNFRVNGGLVAMAVSETSQNADLNSDIDAFDEVIHVYDAGSSLVTNLSFAVEGLELDGQGHLAFGVREFRQAVTDLNGDGDTADLVLHLYDASTGTTQNLLTDATLGFKLDDGMLLGFGASESHQGGGDGNGDGDATDFTLYVFDVSTGNLINLHVDPSGGFQSFQLDGKYVSFGVNELAQGGADLNGDADFGDIVLHYFDASTGVTTNLMMDVTLGHQIQDGKIAFAVTEDRQGMTDLNGDGDALDVVLHVADLDAQETLSPHDMIEALIAHVESLDLPRHIERSRVLLLRLAQGALERDKPCLAIRFLKAFQLSVKIKAGRGIHRADARALIQEAGDIIDVLKEQHPDCARHDRCFKHDKHGQNDKDKKVKNKHGKDEHGKDDKHDKHGKDKKHGKDPKHQKNKKQGKHHR